MEAIAELLVAIVCAFAQIVALSVEVVLTPVGLVLEFLLIVLTEGLTAAREKYKQRKADHENREKLAEANRDRKAAGGVKPSISFKSAVIVGAIVFVSLGTAITASVVEGRIRQQRIQSTKTQVNELADLFEVQIKEKKAAAPKPGQIVDCDGWNERIELFVDKTLAGSLVVVRSPGPDRRSGTIDDILAIRVIEVDAKDVAAEVVDRGMDGIRKRVAKFLPANEQAKHPANKNLD